MSGCSCASLRKLGRSGGVPPGVKESCIRPARATCMLAAMFNAPHEKP